MNTLTSPPPSRIEIDLARLERNFLTLRRLATAALADQPHAPRPTRVCVALKKDAYGLGAVPIAHRLTRAGCDMLAVFAPAEAELLVQKAVTSPLLMLMPLWGLSRTDPLYRPAVAEKLHLSVHDLDQLAAIQHTGRTFGIRFPVHLYLDTGMSRGGLNAEQARQMMNQLPALSHIRLAGLYTHLASVDAKPEEAAEQLTQLRAFTDAHRTQLPPDCCVHAANSFGVFRSTDYHLNMIRPGLSVFGYGPELMSGEPILNSLPPLEPVVRWLSQVIHVQAYPAGTAVGYGSACRLEHPALLGLVPVGYGDGYPVALSNRSVVRVLPDEDGRIRAPVTCRVLGRINMDQIVIDLTQAARALGLDAAPSGTALTPLRHLPVEIYSDDPAAPNALPALASLAQSTVYELLCRLSPLVPRKYLQ